MPLCDWPDLVRRVQPKQKVGTANVFFSVTRRRCEPNEKKKKKKKKNKRKKKNAEANGRTEPNERESNQPETNGVGKNEATTSN